MNTTILAVVVLGVMGGVFGLVLGFAAKIFHGHHRHKGFQIAQHQRQRRENGKARDGFCLHPFFPSPLGEGS